MPSNFVVDNEFRTKHGWLQKCQLPVCFCKKIHRMAAKIGIRYVNFSS